MTLSNKHNYITKMSPELFPFNLTHRHGVTTTQHRIKKVDTITFKTIPNVSFRKVEVLNLYLFRLTIPPIPAFSINADGK